MAPAIVGASSDSAMPELAKKEWRRPELIKLEIADTLLAAKDILPQNASLATKGRGQKAAMPIILVESTVLAPPAWRYSPRSVAPHRTSAIVNRSVKLFDEGLGRRQI